jgi:hypothetical protein
MAKFLSLSSEKMVSDEEERRCFFFFGTVAAKEDAEGVEVDATGVGLMSAGSISTWAVSSNVSGEALDTVRVCVQFLMPITSSTRPS